jgi:hypothetical protein
MLTRIFPRQFDNAYGGHRLAIWLLVPLLALKLLMGGNSMLNPRLVALSADGIPLDSLGTVAADAVIGFLCVWGLGQVLLALQGVLALIRYRSMIPLIYLLLLIEQAGRKVIFTLHPIAGSGGATIGSSGLSIGAAITYVLWAMILGGLLLSLLRKSAQAAR